MDIKIDPEFQALLPPLSREERAQLRENLERDGCRDPLVLWKEEGALLDGHNRLALCSKLGIQFETVEVSLPSRMVERDR